MNCTDVSAAFTFVERTYGRTPCHHCKGRQTIGTICQGVVIASCEDCGGGTRIGALAALWNPQAETSRERPALWAPQERPTGRTVRRVL
ncbi:hypothetical protein [Streptomyces sp. bgisy153]|uniref:hypothetical protein n=1 Tax=Streptomyces sp. bgisy153 TaxID=3413793 RepID=UPI003D71CFCF